MLNVVVCSASSYVYCVLDNAYVYTYCVFYILIIIFTDS